MLGTTGVGKSSLCNTMAGDPTGQRFLEGNSFDTGTKDFKEENVTLHMDEEGTTVTLIDVPGTGDKDGNDAEYMHMCSTKLRELGFVNCFIIVLNSSSPRFD